MVYVAKTNFNLHAADAAQRRDGTGCDSTRCGAMQDNVSITADSIVSVLSEYKHPACDYNGRVDLQSMCYDVLYAGKVWHVPKCGLHVFENVIDMPAQAQ
jgi:hypothetical protein